MRSFVNAIKDPPHAEERPLGASRSTHDADAAPAPDTTRDLVEILDVSVPRMLFHRRQRLGSQCLDVEAERPVDVPHRERDVIDATDHGAETALRIANARMKVATAPSTAALTPR